MPLVIPKRHSIMSVVATMCRVLSRHQEWSGNAAVNCRCLSSSPDAWTKQVTLVKDNIMPRLIILSGVDDEGVRVDISRAYASISSNAQCQVSLNQQTHVMTVYPSYLAFSGELLRSASDDKCDARALHY